MKLQAGYYPGLFFLRFSQKFAKAFAVWYSINNKREKEIYIQPYIQPKDAGRRRWVSIPDAGSIPAVLPQNRILGGSFHDTAIYARV